jgi:hypothetical protein
MNDINLRSDRISHYQAKLKHLDQLLERAHQKKEAEHEKELEQIAARREHLARQLTEMKDWKEEEIEQAGPMAVWDSLAQQLESLIERIEKK